MRPASKEQHANTTRTFCDAQRHVVRAALQTPVEIICTCLLPICLSKEMLFASFWNASELQWTSLALMRRLLLKIRQLLPPQIPCARIAKQIATWMHYPPDQKLSSRMFPAHATRTDEAMSMLPVDADVLMRS